MGDVAGAQRCSPVRTSNCAPCTGHVMVVPLKRPSDSPVVVEGAQLTLDSTHHHAMFPDVGEHPHGSIAKVTQIAEIDFVHVGSAVNPPARR